MTRRWYRDAEEFREMQADRDHWKARAEALEKVAEFAEHGVCNATRPWDGDDEEVWRAQGCPIDCTCGLDAARKAAGL